jgi:hypothetical protein
MLIQERQNKVLGVKFQVSRTPLPVGEGWVRKSYRAGEIGQPSFVQATDARYEVLWMAVQIVVYGNKQNEKKTACLVHYPVSNCVLFNYGKRRV